MTKHRVGTEDGKDVCLHCGARWPCIDIIHHDVRQTLEDDEMVTIDGH